MVEQIDAETFDHWKQGNASNIVEEPLHQEPVVSKTWFHTGAFLGKDQILNQFKEDFWYAEMESKKKWGDLTQKVSFNNFAECLKSEIFLPFRLSFVSFVG